MNTKAILSAFTGFLFGFICYYILCLLKIGPPLEIALFSGVLFALLLFPVLVIYENVMSKRYEAFEREINSPIFYKTNGNFNLGNGKVKNGNIYFCEAGIVCVSLEGKPYTADEILLQNIDHYTYTLTQLNIFTTDQRLFVITVPKADEIIDILMRKGWIKPR